MRNPTQTELVIFASRKLSAAEAVIRLLPAGQPRDAALMSIANAQRHVADALGQPEGVRRGN